jgi:hypothetical protein
MAGDLYRIGIQIEDTTDSLYRLRQSLIATRLKVNNKPGSGSVWPDG